MYDAWMQVGCVCNLYWSNVKSTDQNSCVLRTTLALWSLIYFYSQFVHLINRVLNIFDYSWGIVVLLIKHWNFILRYCGTFERIRQCSDSSKGLFFIACNSTVFYFRAIELSRARNTLKNINIDSTLISLHFPTFFSLICDDSYDWIMLKLRGSEALETTMCYEFVRHPGAQLLHICDGVQDTTDAQQICIFCD